MVNRVKDLVLVDGVMDGVFKYLGNEQYTGRNIHLVGKLNARVVFERQFNATATFDIDDGKLDFSKRVAPVFTGKLSFVLGPSSTPFSITTPCKDDAEINMDNLHDEHIYPIKINLHVDNPVTFKDLAIKIAGHKIEDFHGASNQTSLTLEIPKGYGEYDPDHDDCNEISSNIHNQDRGEDDIKDKQEVARADVNVRNCTMHTWLVNDSYPVKYEINFEYKISRATNKPIIVINPKLDVSRVKLRYIRHGCDDILTGAIIDFFVDIDKKINSEIQEQVDKVAERISRGVVLEF